MLVLAIAAISAFGGCYTVLKHPPTAEVVDGGESRRDCFDCHSDSGPAHRYDPMVAPGFSYLDDQWYPWYAYPWWYRDYWYWDRYDHASGSGDLPASPDTQNDDRRHLWGRGGIHYGPPSLPPLIGSPAGGGGSPAGGTTEPAGEKDKNSGRTMKSGQNGPADQNQGNDKDNKKDKDKKEEKKQDGRNVWKRGGGK